MRAPAEAHHGLFSNGEIKRWRNIGIVCGAVLALAGVATLAWNVSTAAGAWMWSQANRENALAFKDLRVQMRASEARDSVRFHAGEIRDSLMLVQVGRIAEALQYPLGSEGRQTPLQKAVAVKHMPKSKP